MERYSDEEETRLEGDRGLPSTYSCSSQGTLACAM